MRKLLILSLLFFMIISSSFAVGAPVFDIEGWIYSVLQYSESLSSAANFVEQMKREAEQYQAIYEALNSGDIMGAFNRVSNISASIQKNVQKKGVQEQIGTQVYDITKAGLDFSNHSSDPKYFARLLDEVVEIGSHIKNTEAEHKADREKDLVANNENLVTANEEVYSVSGSESESQKIAKNLQVALDNQALQVQDSANAEIDELIKKNEEERQEAEKIIWLNMHYAAQNKANEDAAAIVKANRTQVNVDMSNPYKGL